MSHLRGAIAFLIFITSVVSKSAEVYFTPSKDCENKIVSAIVDSKKEIAIAVYSINNKRIVNALETAHRQGVKIRILTDSLQAAGRSSKVIELTDAGLDLRVHSVHKIMHNKFAVFDNSQAISGSFNWTEAASNLNSENCVLFTEPNVLQSYKKQFETLWSINTSEKSQTKLAKLRMRNTTRVPTGE